MDRGLTRDVEFLNVNIVLYARSAQRLIERLLFFRFRIVANTRQPREARTTAVASPIPLDVPVISTDRMSESPTIRAFGI